MAVRGAGGREGGQEEDKEVALVGAHLHKKQEESIVNLVRHNSNCQLHSTVGQGKRLAQNYCTNCTKFSSRLFTKHSTKD